MGHLELLRCCYFRLERRIEMFEREREDHRQRQQKRLEKQQREQEEYLKKQKVTMATLHSIMWFQSSYKLCIKKVEYMKMFSKF